MRYKHTEIVKDWKQGGDGIGVLLWEDACQ